MAHLHWKAPPFPALPAGRACAQRWSWNLAETYAKHFMVVKARVVVYQGVEKADSKLYSATKTLYTCRNATLQRHNYVNYFTLHKLTLFLLVPVGSGGVRNRCCCLLAARLNRVNLNYQAVALHVSSQLNNLCHQCMANIEERHV